MDRFELQALRDQPIEAVAGRLGISVERHKALCPFHDDHHASLTFHTGRNTCRCFVCMDRSMGPIDLVMQVRHTDFMDACRWLGYHDANWRGGTSGGLGSGQTSVKGANSGSRGFGNGNYSGGTSGGLGSGGRNGATSESFGSEGRNGGTSGGFGGGQTSVNGANSGSRGYGSGSYDGGRNGNSERNGGTSGGLGSGRTLANDGSRGFGNGNYSGGRNENSERNRGTSGGLGSEGRTGNYSFGGTGINGQTGNLGNGTPHGGQPFGGTETGGRLGTFGSGTNGGGMNGGGATDPTDREVRAYYPRGSDRSEPYEPEPTFDASRYERFFQRPWLSDEARRFLYDERRLDERVVRWCRLTSWTDRQGTPWLQIPYYDAEGRLIGVQNRNLAWKRPEVLTVKETGSGGLPSDGSGVPIVSGAKGEAQSSKGFDPKEVPRFRFPRGARCSIYGLQIVPRLREGDEVYITEGCSDCWAMLSAGRKAIAIPSATLLSTADAELLVSLGERLRLQWHMYPDQDVPGERLYLQLRALLPNLQHHQLPTGCKDVGEAFSRKRAA